jgi:alkanesulfonate monooxygenase SsuD/methylene tetrahydromethanopterin reductase-like flavin-dependent oxidoreductase (luciferase family)
VKIGVLRPSRFTEAGDYLADARAFDAAGVDSLWLPDDGFDPWLVTASVATVTGRCRLAVPVSARDCESVDTLARRMTTLDFDCLSRVRMLTAIASRRARRDRGGDRGRPPDHGRARSAPDLG